MRAAALHTSYAADPGFARPGLVGRDDELTRALSLLVAESAPRPSLVIVRGPAGIGRTAFSTEVLRRLDQQRVRTLRSTPFASDRSLQLSTYCDLFEGAALDVLTELPLPQRNALRAALLHASAVPHPDDDFALAAATLEVVRKLAATAPLVIAIDDIQHADPATRQMLSFALRRLIDTPVSLFLTVPDDGDFESLSELLEALPEERTHVVDLEPLDVDELDTLLRRRLDAKLPRTALQELHRETFGNPFWSLLVVQQYKRHGVGYHHTGIRRTVLPLPNATLRRIEDLGAEARRALEVVAVIRRPNEELVRTAIAAFGLDADIFDAACASGLCVVAEGRVGFGYPMLRVALASQLTGRHARDVHRVLAAAFEPLDPSAAAWHAAHAVDLPCAAVLDRLDVAAREAAQAGDIGTAAAYAELASQATAPGDSAAMWRRVLRAAELQRKAGDADRARTLLAQALALAGADEGSEGIEGGSLRALTLFERGRLELTSSSVPEAVRVLNEAVRAGLAGVELAKAHIELAFAAICSADWTSARVNALDAVAVARSSGSEPALAAASSMLLFERYLGGHGVHAEAAQALEALARPEVLARVPLPRRPEAASAFIAAHSGERERAAELLATLLDEAHARGDEGAVAEFASALAFVLLDQGKVDTALASARLACARARQTGQNVRLAWVLSILARVLAVTGALDDARLLAREAKELAERTGFAGALLLATEVSGFIELAADAPTTAAAHYRVLVDFAEISGVGEPSLMEWVPDACEAFVAAGRRDDASTALQLFEKAVAARPAASMSLETRVALAYATAVVVAAAGDTRDAVEAFGSALQLAASGGPASRACPNGSAGSAGSAGSDGFTVPPLLHGRLLLAAGTHAARMRHRRSAAAHLRGAFELLGPLGACTFAARAEREVAHLGDTARSGRAALTPTEERIARFVASGRSNREVAEAYGMSPRTVEVHLSRVYRKLGLRSRSQIAAAL